MQHRKIRSGLLTLKCENCNNVFQEFSRDVDSMSGRDCPQCQSLETDVIDCELDEKWTQDAQESAKNRELKKQALNEQKDKEVTNV